MSFRVWFLRMVWIVAAAVALSGCDKDDPDTNGNGEGDGPTLAVAVTPADVTMGADANGDHDVKVTITSDDDAHKTAEVELSVACTEDIDAPPAIETAKKDAAAGMAEWEGQSVGLDAATVCTYTAKALEKEATGTFTVKADEEPAVDTPAIILGTPTEDGVAAGTIKVSFTHNLAASITFMVHVACDANTYPVETKVLDAPGTTCSDTDTTANGIQCMAEGTDNQKCAVLIMASDDDKTKSELKNMDL